MADVRLRPGREDASGDPRSRAQLFLVGALALAVVFIALATLLNTAIYTENLATRSDGHATSDLIEYQGVASDHAATAMHTVNYRNNTSYTALEANYSQSTSNWSDIAATHRAAHSHVASTTLANTTSGTRIEQDTNRTFTDANSAADWELAPDAGVRAFVLEVNRASLLQTDTGSLLTDDPFVVNFTESDGDTWSAYVYQDSTNPDRIEVSVKDPARTTVGTCNVDASRARVDITNASLEGDSCGALAFFDDLDADYDISYANGGQAEGTYSLVVDRVEGDLDASHYGTQPYITPALYDATHDLTYRTPEAYYETTIRVAPGEPDA